ncbi:hypothetical protein C8Q77DRAFT_1273719 [Trametes polyzona]|nr:hypothetical protein C8Q77DRAFT_1273719 [Trametes polyzona]
MSASALADPRKRILVQDDMESFFHILLYLAIRYLPHDCRNVGLFMDQYFDGHLEIDGEYLGGDLKWNTMRNGELAFAQAKITFYVADDPVDPLAQAAGTSADTPPNSGPVKESVEGDSLGGQPPPTPTAPAQARPWHPINDLFTYFLIRLKAHYILKVPHRAVRNRAKAANPIPPKIRSFTQEQSIKENNENAQKMAAGIFKANKEMNGKATTAAGTPSTPALPKMTATEKAELVALAKELGDQDEIGALLFSSLNATPWPKYGDRVPDQLDPKYRRNVEERAASQAKRRADRPPESDSRPSKTSRSMR